MKLFVAFADDGTAERIVVEHKGAGGQVVSYTHASPDGEGRLQPLPTPAVVAAAIAWAIARFAEARSAALDAALVEHAGVSPAELPAVRAAIEGARGGGR